MAAISNNEIKRVKSLQQKKFRDETGLFVVEGEKMVEEACASALAVEKVYYRDEIGQEAMSRISALTSPSPVLAVVRKPSDVCLDSAGQIESIKSRSGLYLGLDSIRDPGNLGTILRIADWFGIDAVFATRDTVDVFNPKVVQATMGAIFRVKFHYVDLPELSRCILDADGKVAQMFIDNKCEPSEWLQDEPKSYSYEIKADVKPGTYLWAVAIVDTSLENIPGIQLAIARLSKTEDGWTKLANVTVE